jgi:hypothetical protein
MPISSSSLGREDIDISESKHMRCFYRVSTGIKNHSNHFVIFFENKYMFLSQILLLINSISP